MAFHTINGGAQSTTGDGRNFSVNEVDPQRLEHDREEKFNYDLFKRCGELGLLGVTTDVACGAGGMDATAACIVHEELGQADPGFCLAYLAHSMLFVNNLNFNGNEEQKQRFLPGACTGELVGGMGMSEPGAGTDVLGMTTTAKKDGDDYIERRQNVDYEWTHGQWGNWCVPRIR